MDYRIRHNSTELQSTGYIEIGPGKYTGKHWQAGFIFVRDDAFSVVEGIVEWHFPDYNHFEMNDIPKDVATRIILDWRTAADLLPTIDQADIEVALKLTSPLFVGLIEKIDLGRQEISVLLRSLADECDGFMRQADWICILGV